MTRTTQQLRDLWSPPCTGPWARFTLYGGGVVTVDPLIVDALRALNACLVAHDYASRRADTGAYNCRPITGGSRYSLHAYGIAIDVNWTTNPYGAVLRTDMPPAMIRAVEAIRTNGGAVVWRWGGRYSGNKDAMHFEVVASPAELARGIDPATVPGGAPKPNPTTPKPEPHEELPMTALAYRLPDGKVWACSALGRRHVKTREELNGLAVVGLIAPVPEKDPNREDGWVRKAPKAAVPILEGLKVLGS